MICGEEMMGMDNKNIIFLGSSVTYGDAGWSMCEYVKETIGCNVIKWAVSGTTLSNLSEQSYVSRLDRQIVNQDKCDCFICQLSTNDAKDIFVLGEIADSKNADDFETTTIIGAIEYILSRVKEKWSCPILFYTGTYMENTKYQQMVYSLIELSKKWHFEIIDLWNNPRMRAIDAEKYSEYMNDPVHPNKLGYKEWWGPEFVNAIIKVLNNNVD